MIGKWGLLMDEQCVGSFYYC